MKLYCPITIDLYKVYPLQVMEAQQGNVGRGAIVTLTAGSAVIDPTDETVEVYAKKPDGTVSWLECSVEDAKVKINFTNQMLMSPGMLQVELRMKDDEDDITTPIFMVKVNKSNVQSAGRSENELPLLDQIKKNAEDAKTAAEAAETAVGKLSEDIADLKENGTGTGLTDDLKSALKTYFTNMQTLLPQLAYATEENMGNILISNAQAVVTALDSSGGSTEPDEPIEPDNPEVTLTSISATYTGGEVAVGTSVNSLTGITVTATYSDGSTANVTGYTLSGTIADGNNTITVSYGGKTTTFTVVGIVEVEDTRTLLYQWDFTGSEPLVDKVTGATATIVTGSPTLNSNGLTFTSETDRISLINSIDSLANCDVELEMGNFSIASPTKHLRLLTFNSAFSAGFICRNMTRNWSFYSTAWTDGTLAYHEISDKTVKLSFDDSNNCIAYVNGSEIVGSTAFAITQLSLGSNSNSANGLVVKEIKIYERGE